MDSLYPDNSMAERRRRHVKRRITPVLPLVGALLIGLAAPVARADFVTPATPTSTPVVPTDTPMPPTNTPTSIPAPPTSTPVPPTSTPAPLPTDTPVPSTGPAVNLSRTSINFGNQLVGTTSAPQLIVLTNTGSSYLFISNISFVPPYGISDFGETETCTTAPLRPGASCTISVTFAPVYPGVRTGQLAITDNAPDSPQTIFLTGNALYAGVYFSPYGLNFGDQGVGSSTTQQIIVNSNGTAPLTVTNVTVGGSNAGDFAITQDSCISAPIPPGSSCTVSVAFTPTASGSRSANLLVTDNAADSPQYLFLSGNGVYPVLTLVPTWLDFGDVRIRTHSVAQYLYLFNTGTVPATVTSVSIGGLDPTNFQQANTCTAAPIVPGTYCTITVRFTPKSRGHKNATLIVTDNAASHLQSATLLGTGVTSGASGNGAVSVSGNNTINFYLGAAANGVAVGHGGQSTDGGAATMLQRARPIVVRLHGLPYRLSRTRVTMTVDLWSLQTAPRSLGTTRHSRVRNGGTSARSLLYHGAMNMGGRCQRTGTDACPLEPPSVT